MSMDITLNVAERVTIMAALRARQSSFVDDLLEYNDLSKFFELTPEEKVMVEWQEQDGGQVKYKDEKDGEQYACVRLFSLDENMVEAILNQMRVLTARGAVTAANEDFLNVYRKLTV